METPDSPRLPFFRCVTPSNQGLKCRKTLKSLYIIRSKIAKQWFFLRCEMQKSGVYFEKTVFFHPSITPPDYPKCVTPNIAKCNP